VTYEQAVEIANPAFTKALHLALREAGVLIMPSAYGRIYISFEHNSIVIEEMKVAFEKAAAKLSAEFANA
jgi:glutamate-1-semialdehyde 2,1-aminomutase